MQRLRAIFLAAAVVPLLSGCCTSYYRIAKVDRATVDGAKVGEHIARVGLTGVIGNVVMEFDRTAAAERVVDAKRTVYRISRDGNIVYVSIDDQTDTIRLGWDWRNHSDLPSRLQSAIEREYSATYHAPLRFEQGPCGWLGP